MSFTYRRHQLTGLTCDACPEDPSNMYIRNADERALSRAAVAAGWMDLRDAHHICSYCRSLIYPAQHSSPKEEEAT